MQNISSNYSSVSKRNDEVGVNELDSSKQNRINIVTDS